MSSLELAQEARRARAEVALDRHIDSIIDYIGLDTESVAKLAIGPDARKKLSGIIKRLARKKKPFTTCMHDLAKHRPELDEESRKRICGRLKSVVDGTGKAKALSMSDDYSACELVDADVFALLMAVDEDKLAALVAAHDEKEAS